MMIRIVRRVGIAVGSFVIAYMAVSLLAGLVLGPAAATSPVVGVVIVVLGGLVFADIVRRERPKATAAKAPTG